MKTTLSPLPLLLLALVFAWGRPDAAANFRTFTNASGRTIEASVKTLDGGQVTIAMKDGREFTIPVATLSAADQAYLKEWKPAAPDGAAEPAAAPAKALGEDKGMTIDAINEMIGQPIFKEISLWDSDPERVAERLSWPRESETPFSESFRAYPKPDYRFLGARPYSAALYGVDDRVTSVSLVFANKGDSFGAAGSGEEHFIKGKPVPGGIEGFRLLMENDAQVIESALTEKLGKPQVQRFGEGETRAKVNRWDWNGHSFILSFVEDEYVSLAIETVEFADNGGKTARVRENVIRDRVRGAIEKRPNGDVIITGIPMVDQGPKGYCAPATAERCMRFLGVPADMYLLAMAGQTQMGGGTSITLLLENIGRDIKRKGRSFDGFGGELKLRELKRHIDGGIPVMWTLFSTKEFNEISNKRTKLRAEEKDFAAYASQVKAEAENAVLPPQNETSHVVIIIGYNEESNEIAFSDSWGERYQERWITVEEAEQVSQKRFFVIDL